jgi:hypothetical protein
MAELNVNHKGSWFSAIWDVLEMARDGVIPEGQPEYDEVWNDTCTAMAWLEEEIDPWLLAEMSLEVASYLPDDEKSQANQTRADWRHNVVRMAEQCIRECGVTPETEDIDEVFVNWLAKEESLS